jgi:hypothetical protein
MNTRGIRKSIVAFTLVASVIGSHAADEDDMAWFKNELMCADTKVTIKSYCRDEPERRVNTLCTMQTAVMEKSGKKKIVRDLLEREPSRGYFHSLRSVRCVSGNTGTYLYLSLGNGGNCIGCENQAVMDLDGRWKRYGDRWYARSIEKEDIERHHEAWFKQESILLENKVRD